MPDDEIMNALAGKAFERGGGLTIINNYHVVQGPQSNPVMELMGSMFQMKMAEKILGDASGLFIESHNEQSLLPDNSMRIVSHEDFDDAEEPMNEVHCEVVNEEKSLFEPKTVIINNKMYTEVTIKRQFEWKEILRENKVFSKNDELAIINIVYNNKNSKLKETKAIAYFSSNDAFENFSNIEKIKAKYTIIIEPSGDKDVVIPGELYEDAFDLIRYESVFFDKCKYYMIPYTFHSKL